MTSTRSSRTLVRSVLALTLGILGLVAAASPAVASPAPAPPDSSSRPASMSAAAPSPAKDVAALVGCPADSVCLYNDKDFNGHVFTLAAGGSTTSLHAFACSPCDSPKHGAGDGNFGDQMSAWVNNTSWSYCWYYDINYRSYVNVMPPGSAVAWVGTRAQDEASSIRPC
ncbi:peptidase inhibitor family I36 protein [Actinoplanes sp. GCM10030250]|uniref:peptidase inhibitor family I36 protein n=1 Tax=Actinoplanes sp. GCM10030250 TaxID=3273376 RepID=UPI0036174E08